MPSFENELPQDMVPNSVRVPQNSPSSMCPQPPCPVADIELLNSRMQPVLPPVSHRFVSSTVLRPHHMCIISLITYSQSILRPRHLFHTLIYWLIVALDYWWTLQVVRFRSLCVRLCSSAPFHGTISCRAFSQ